MAVKPSHRRGRGTPPTRGECARRLRTESCGDHAERLRSVTSMFWTLRTCHRPCIFCVIVARAWGRRVFHSIARENVGLKCCVVRRASATMGRATSIRLQARLRRREVNCTRAVAGLTSFVVGCFTRANTARSTLSLAATCDAVGRAAFPRPVARACNTRLCGCVRRLIRR